MKKPLLILFLLSFFLSAQAQDKKLQRLYNHAQYCDCIERFNKFPHKMKTSDALFIAASSYYHLFKIPDNECNIKDPLSKCLITLAKIKKSKSNDLIEGLPELIEDAVSAGFETYRVDMKNRQWEDALTMIERIKKVQTNSELLIDQARCAYALAQPTALETTCYALNFYAANPDEKSKEYFFSQTNKILLRLDSTMNNDFQLFMDTLFKIFPDNELLANTFYTHWKRDIRKYSTAKEYDFLFQTMKIIFKYYPNRQDWKLEMNNIVLSMADSLTQDFLDNQESLSSYIQCYNFLMKARISLGEIVSNLKRAKYYSVESMGRDFEITSYSGSSGITNTIEFSINYNRETSYKIDFDAAVPRLEMEKIKGIIWKDVPNNKKAKKKTDIVQSETFNSLLLDTLTHVYCNKFRAQNKKKPLIWSDPIYKASKHHSRNLAFLGCLIHGEERDSLFGQPDSIDYYLHYLGPRNMSAGENILYGYWSDKITYESLAKKIIKQWENSPGHRANMLQDKYTHESVSSTITNFSGQLGAFLDFNVAKEYYPELTQLFKVLPELKEKSLKPDVNYFSSQNFNGEN